MFARKPRSVLIVLLSSILLAIPAAGQDVPEEFALLLDTRKELGSISFATDAIQLDAVARKSVKSAFSLVSAHNNKIIRLEGFSAIGHDESKAIRTAMLRAKAVRDYLAQLGITDVYVTGFASRPSENMKSSDTDRVEIAIYDKLLDIDGAQVVETIETFAAE